MYESPIEIIQHKIRSDISSRVDDAIYTAVVRTDIHVDRDELIKALSYDRGQYEKGFSDGLEEGKPKWISVKDRLPEKGTYVAVYYGKFTGNIVDVMAWDGEAWYKTALREDAEWITHWMPLPEPPEEE